MSNNEINAVLEKLERLHRLANDPAATENEARVALAKLQQLLDKHNLTIDSLSNHAESKRQNEAPGRIVFDPGVITDWKHYLITYVAAGYGCRGGRVFPDQFVVVGFKESVITTIRAYRALVAIAETLVKEVVQRYKASMLGVDARTLPKHLRYNEYGESYLIGFTQGVDYALRAQRKRSNEADPNVAAMVLQREGLVKSTMRNFYPNWGDCTLRSATNDAARNEGYRDGANAVNAKPIGE